MIGEKLHDKIPHSGIKCQKMTLRTVIHLHNTCTRLIIQDYLPCLALSWETNVYSVSCLMGQVYQQMMSGNRKMIKNILSPHHIDTSIQRVFCRVRLINIPCGWRDCGACLMGRAQVVLDTANKAYQEKFSLKLIFLSLMNGKHLHV